MIGLGDKPLLDALQEKILNTDHNRASDHAAYGGNLLLYPADTRYR